MTATDPAVAAEALRQIQSQQLLTAWIQAGAAVAQAIGALLAIWISVRLANQAAAREIAADHAATARAEAAEQAAMERAVAAERRAEEREELRQAATAAQVEAEKTDSHNGPIDLVLGLTDVAIKAAREESERFGAISDSSYYGYRLWGAEAEATWNAISAAIERTHDVALTLALNNLRETLARGKENPGAKPAGDVSNDFERFARLIEAKRKPVEDCRR